MTATRNSIIGLAVITIALVALQPVEAAMIAGQIKAAFVDAYTVSYFDRATWSVGCY